MVFYSTPQGSLSPLDDELAESDSPYHPGHPNTVPSFSRPAPPSHSSNTQARMLHSLGGMRTDTSPNVGAASNTFIPAGDAFSYPFNMPTYPTYHNHSEPNVSSNGYSPYHREATTTHAMVDNIPRSQDHYATAGSMSYDLVIPPTYPVTYGPQSISAAPVRNSPSYHDTQYHNTTQEGADARYPQTPATGGNPSPPYPLMQYQSNYNPHPTQHALPRDPSSSSYRDPSFYRREPSFYPDSFAHHPEAYHGSWPQGKDHAIYDLPGPSTAPSRLAAISSHPDIGHGNNTINHSYRPPSIQPHQDLLSRNSHSRHNSQRRRGSTSETPHSLSTTFSCCWLIGENTTCQFEGPLAEFKAHFRGSHLSGSQGAENVCCWRGCGYRKRNNAAVRSMRRDSVWRHVWETHLGWKRVNH